MKSFLQSTVTLPVAVIAGLGAGASTASAVTVETTWINANVSVNGLSDGSSATPVATANATSTDGPDVHKGSALQNENGFSSLELTVSCAGNEGNACSGNSQEIENRATAIREVTFTNDTGVAQSGIFSFSLSGMELETWHYGGSDPEASVQFAVGATNGATYFAEMTLLTTFDQSPDHQIITSTNFTGTVDSSECSFGYCYKGSVDVDPLSGSISLGTLAPGASVAVQTTFDIFTIYSGTEVGGQARAVDPGSYSWSFSPAGSVSTVPLPASGWALLSACALAGVLRRRRTRS